MWQVKLLRLWGHDFWEGIWNRRVYFLLPVMVALFSCIGLHAKMTAFLDTNHNVGAGTLMDYWIYLVQGGKHYKFDIYTIFQIPVRWLCFHVFILIGLNNYPLNDLHGWGYHVLLKSKSRWNWWFSKILWCFSYVACYYIVCLFIVSVYALANDASFSLRPSIDVMNMVSRTGFLKCSMKRLVCIVLVQPVMLSAFLGILQLVLCICMKPVYSFMVMFAMLVVSTYKRYWILIGNWGMPYRMYPVQKHGLDPKLCMVLLLCGILIGVLCGYLVFCKKDILEQQ